MGIRNLRGLAGPQGCQAVINGEKCHREDNATVHRKGRANYHEYQAEANGETEDDA